MLWVDQAVVSMPDLLRPGMAENERWSRYLQPMVFSGGQWSTGSCKAAR